MITDAEMTAIIASDPVIKSLEGKVVEHSQQEVERADVLRKRISETWAEIRELKQQRGVLNRAIHNRTTAVRAMVHRTRARKPHAINRRIAARKVYLRRREETRLARAITKQAIADFRKRVGIPPNGIEPK